MHIEVKPYQIRLDMIERLTVFLCHDQYGPTWEQYALEGECREQAGKIVAAIEEWLPFAAEHRPAVLEDGEVIQPAESRYLGAWIPEGGPRWAP